MAIPTSSRAPVRNPKSNFRLTLKWMRATASTIGRSHPVKRGSPGSAGVIARSPFATYWERGFEEI